jgi:HPt (histidine-containing phosphotransfer) domain-containing protein
MAGDRERFLEAGMDAYVPKPLDARLLFDTMEDLLSRAAPAAEPSAPVPSSVDPARVAAEAAPNREDGEAEMRGAPPGQDEAPIDRAAALVNVGGDEELLVEIIDLYLEDSPRVRETLRAAAATGDSEGVWKAAHRLKGSVGSLSAQPAFDAARALETAGREGAVDEVLLAQLEAELDRLEGALNALRGEVAG